MILVSMRHRGVGLAGAANSIKPRVLHRPSAAPSAPRLRPRLRVTQLARHQRRFCAKWSTKSRRAMILNIRTIMPIASNVITLSKIRYTKKTITQTKNRKCNTGKTFGVSLHCDFVTHEPGHFRTVRWCRGVEVTTTVKIN